MKRNTKPFMRLMMKNIILLSAILLAVVFTGCSKDEIEEGDYSKLTEGMVTENVGGTTVYFIPTSDGMSVTWNRNEMTWEHIQQMLGSSYAEKYGGTGIAGLSTYEGEVSIPSAVAGKSVTAIDKWAFCGNVRLTKVVMPGTITTIGDEAFTYCSALTSADIPTGVTTIGDGAFAATTLTEVTIPNGVKRIGRFSFAYIQGLTAIHIDAANSKLEEIAPCAFIGAKNSNSTFTDITLPASVKSIGSYAFAYCKKLKNINIPEGITGIEPFTFNNCAALANPIWPATLKNVGASAYASCTTMTIADLSATSLTTLGEKAFSGCSKLTTVTLPATTKEIGESCFSSCSKLTKLYIKATTPPATGSVVTGSPQKVTLYVPTGSKDAYAAVETWSKFKDIIEED